MHTRPTCLALLAAGLAFTLMPVLAAPPKLAENARIEQILAQRDKVQQIRRVALSWNGQQLAYIVEQNGKNRLELASWRGNDPHTVQLAGDCQPEDIAWRRKAMTLAVLTRCKVDPSNTKPIKSSIQLLDTDGNHPARVLAQLDGFAQDLRWSRSGERIGFLYVSGATRLPYATASGNPRVGVIGVQDVQVQQVATIGLDGGKPEVLTPHGLYVYEFSWSRFDDSRIAYTAAPPPGDDNWWTAKLYVQDAQAGAASTMIVDPVTVKGPLHGLQIALPRWSFHDNNIFFIGGLMSDRGATGGDIYRVPVAGGAATDLTQDSHVTHSWFKVGYFNHGSLLVSQIVRGKVQLAEYGFSSPASLKQRALLFTLPASIGDGREALAVSLSGDPRTPRRIAYTQSSFTEPPEIHSGVLGTQPPPAVTSFNKGLKAGWGKAKSVEWDDKGVHVQGWLMYPADFDAHKSYPMIVYVHGGPSWATLPGWGNTATAYSTFGYFVLMPNPRGSFGEGEKFAQAIRGQMGYGDLDDILAGVDKVEKIAPIDNHRLGITGWSYGGFMSMFAPTQTNRFRAAVAGAGLSDWKSYYGENQIDGWMIPFFGASVYDDPAAYAKSSAINFIKHDHTPALIVVGERDEECPAPQSFEYWHALKTLGVPTTLVVYANQGHHIVNHKDQADILRRSLDWFAKYLSASTQ